MTGRGRRITSFISTGPRASRGLRSTSTNGRRWISLSAKAGPLAALLIFRTTEQVQLFPISEHIEVASDRDVRAWPAELHDCGAGIQVCPEDVRNGGIHFGLPIFSEAHGGGSLVHALAWA